MAINYMRDELMRRVNIFRPFGGDVLLEIDYGNFAKYSNIPFATFNMLNSGPRIETPDIKRVKAYYVMMQIDHSEPQKSGDYHKMTVEWDLKPLDISKLDAKQLLEHLKNAEKIQ